MAHSTIEVSTTEIARHFGDYLARVRYGGDLVLVTKNNRPVAELRSYPSQECTLAQLLDAMEVSPADPEFADDLESVSHSDRPLSNPWA